MGFCRRQGDYIADNSRSDLSDILEEEEEDYYSDHRADSHRGYAARVRDGDLVAAATSSSS